jgi:16S rRNA (cytidine1402-2'-O)-methyltransferase
MAKALLHGYLPIEKTRKASFKSLERISFEKINLKYLLRLHIETINIGRFNSNIKSKPIYASPQILLCQQNILKQNSCLEKETIDLHKRPTIFIIHKCK